MNKIMKLERMVVTALLLACLPVAHSASLKDAKGACGESCVRTVIYTGWIVVRENSAFVNPGYTLHQVLSQPGANISVVVTRVPALGENGQWNWQETETYSGGHGTEHAECHEDGARPQDKSETQDPGHTTVTQPAMSNAGLRDGTDAGDGGCQSCAGAPGQFQIEIALGRGFNGSAVGKLKYAGNLTALDMLTNEGLELTTYGPLLSGTLAGGLLEVRHPVTNVRITTIAVQKQMTGGLLQSLTITVTPAEAALGVPTTHVFSRAADAVLGDGLQYARTENGETETLKFLAPAAQTAPDGSVLGQFATVYAWGNTSLLTASGGDASTFVWHEDTSLPNYGYFTGELVLTLVMTPAAGAAVVTKKRRNRKLGDNWGNTRQALCAETVTQGSGEAAATFHWRCPRRWCAEIRSTAAA
jgi:hypothetical protein